MKKLMIAAAALAVSFAANAAQYGWQLTNICSGYLDEEFDDNNANGTAYLFLATEALQYSDVAKAVSDGTFLSGDWTGKAIDHTDFSGGIDGLSAEGLAGAVGDKLFAVVVSTSWTPYGEEDVFPVDPAQAFITDQQTLTYVEPLGSTPVDFGDFYDATSVPGGWTAQSVPEPTSGLLLLLGVAGLALRRRRA